MRRYRQDGRSAEQCDSFRPKTDPSRQRRGSPGPQPARPRRSLDHELQALEGEPHRVDDLCIRDGDDLVDELRGDLPRSAPGLVVCKPSAIVRGHVDRYRMPRREREPSSPASGSTPITRPTPAAWLPSQTGDASTAAEQDKRVPRHRVLDQLECRRSRPGHDQVVVVRPHELGAASGGEPAPIASRSPVYRS